MNCSHECAGKFCTNCGASLLKMEEIRSIEDSLKATKRKGIWLAIVFVICVLIEVLREC